MSRSVARRRSKPAIQYVRLYNGRANYKWAENTHTSRDIRLTFLVSGLANGPQRDTVRIYAGDNVELGIIDAGRGQRLSYRKTGARFLN